MIRHLLSSALHMLSRPSRPATIAALALGSLAPFSGNTTAADAVPYGAGVTGTHIRGAADTAFPITIYTREAIAASGATTLQQFIQMLPQNFNGGASENAIGSVTGGGNANNQVGGTGVNLRGLGNEATLVLVNGHRMAAGNVAGNFVDLSLIPLYAVDRIEVVTDGASAIYGSDAVGGVVNIILGRNLDGAETRLRYGTASDGSTRDREVGQTLGHSWDTGSGLLIYDYLDRTPLSASKRAYTSSAAMPFMLLPERLRQNVYGSVDDSVTEGLDLFAQGMYSHKSTYYDATSFGSTLRTEPTIDTYYASAGARLDLPRGAQLEFTGNYSANDTGLDIVQAGAATPSTDERIQSSILSLDAQLNGSVYSLPAGDVRFALGAQFRHENYQSRDFLSLTDFRPERHITAVFAELRVPLIGAKVGGTALNRLELTLADRQEHYSEFGSTNNPQIGLICMPVPALKLRGTYGTSFQAPLLSDLNPVPFEVVPVPEPDPRTAGVTNTLLVFGGDPSLQPEKARTWTAGLDFTPSSLPGLHGSATYYQITFTGVVTNPQVDIDLSNVLAQEAVLGPTIVQRDPSAATVQQFAASPGFANFFGIDLASIGAIFDSRLHNLSIERTSGLDLDGAWDTPTGLGSVELGLRATYVFRFDTQFTSNAPADSILNTAYNPVDLRMRGRAMIQHGGLALASFVNYTNSYEGGDMAGVGHIASWTTVDVTANYLFDFDHGPLSDASVELAVTNLMNRSPPYVPNAVYPGIDFDGANANALGRFVSVQLAKRW